MALLKNYPLPYMRSKKLLKAAYEGDMGYVESVVPSQIHVNQPLETRPNGHSTYLHTLAVDNNQVELLDYCLNMGADALLKGRGGVNLFSHIASSPHVDKTMVDMLFYYENGGEFLNDQTTAGNTIAHAAVLSNNVYCLSALLSMSDVVRVATVRNKKGDTPLHLALKVFSKDNPTVPVMLVNYAKRVSNEPLCTTDIRGFTALELACSFGFSEVVDLITRHRGGYDGGWRPTPKPRSRGGGHGVGYEGGCGSVYEEEDPLDVYEEDGIISPVKVVDKKAEDNADVIKELVTMARTIDELTTTNQSLSANVDALTTDKIALMMQVDELTADSVYRKYTDDDIEAAVITASQKSEASFLDLRKEYERVISKKDEELQKLQYRLDTTVVSNMSEMDEVREQHNEQLDRASEKVNELREELQHFEMVDDTMTRMTALQGKELTDMLCACHNELVNAMKKLNRHQCEEEDKRARDQSATADIICGGEEEIAKLKSTITNLEENKRQVHNLLRSTLSKLTEMESRLTDYSNEVARLTDEVRASVRDRAELLSRFQETLDTIKEEKDILTTQLNTMSSVVEERDALFNRVESLKAEVSAHKDLRGKMAAVISERNNLSTEVDSLNKDRDRLRDALEVISTERDKFGGLTSDLNFLQAQELRDSLEEVMSERNDFPESVNSLTNVIESERIARCAADKTRDELHKELDTVKSRNEALQFEMDTLKVEFKTKLSSMEHERNDLISKRDVLVKEMQCLRTENEELYSNLSDTKASADDRSGRLEGAQQVIDRLRADNSDLQDELDKYQSMYKESNASEEQTKEAVKNLSKELETVRADLSRLQTTLSENKKSQDNAIRLAEQAHQREVKKLNDQTRDNMEDLRDECERKITYLTREKIKMEAEHKRELNDLHGEFSTELKTNSKKHDERMTAALKDHEAEVKVLKQRYEESVSKSDQSMDALLGEMNTLREEKNTAMRQVDNLVEENKLTVDKLKKELSAKNKEMMKLKIEFGRLRKYAHDAKQYMDHYMMPPQQQMVYYIPQQPQPSPVSGQQQQQRRHDPPTSSDIDDLMNDLGAMSLTTTKPAEPK